MTQYLQVTPATPAARGHAIKLYGPEGFAGMRKAGRLSAEILDALVPLVVPGVSTAELDEFVRERIVAAGAIPANIGYSGYQHATAFRSTTSSVTGSRARRSSRPATSSTSI